MELCHNGAAPLFIVMKQIEQLWQSSRESHPCMVLMQPYPLPATVFSRSDYGCTGVSLLRSGSHGGNLAKGYLRNADMNRSFCPSFHVMACQPVGSFLIEKDSIALYNFQGTTVCQPVKTHCIKVCFDRLSVRREQGV